MTVLYILKNYLETIIVEFGQADVLGLSSHVLDFALMGHFFFKKLRS